MAIDANGSAFAKPSAPAPRAKPSIAAQIRHEPSPDQIELRHHRQSSSRWLAPPSPQFCHCLPRLSNKFLALALRSRSHTGSRTTSTVSRRSGRKHRGTSLLAMSILRGIGGPDFPYLSRPRLRYFGEHRTHIVSPGDPVAVSFAPPSEGRLLSKSR